MEVCAAVDPGSTSSAILLFTRSPSQQCGISILGCNFLKNEELVAYLREQRLDLFLIETPRPRGGLVASELFETTIWIGRFLQVLNDGQPDTPWSYVFRGNVCRALLGRATGNDAKVRGALIDLFGGERKAIGGRRCKTCSGKGWRQGDITCSHCSGRKRLGKFSCHHCNGKGSKKGRVECWGCHGSTWETPPGPLKGITSHGWAALGVCLSWLEDEVLVHRISPTKGQLARMKHPAL